MFNSIDEIKVANNDIGHHWFEPTSMRFFRSRVSNKVYGGHYFISSERYDDNSPRLFSIRKAADDGSISTVGEFQKYKTRRAAEIAINDILDMKAYHPNRTSN